MPISGVSGNNTMQELGTGVIYRHISVNEIWCNCIVTKYFDGDKELYLHLYQILSKDETEIDKNKLGIYRSLIILGQNKQVKINPSFFTQIDNKNLQLIKHHQKAKVAKEKYVNIMTDYSNDFPNKVVAKRYTSKWEIMDEKLKAKIEKWYFSVPSTTMQDSYKPQPLIFPTDKSNFSRKRSELSGFVEAFFKGGVIDRPLLDPNTRASPIEKFNQAILEHKGTSE